MFKKIFIVCCGLCTFIKTNEEEKCIGSGFVELQFSSYIPFYGSVKNIDVLYHSRISWSYNSDLNYHNHLLWIGGFFDFVMFSKSWQIDAQFLSCGYSSGVFIKPSLELKLSIMSSFYLSVIAHFMNIKGLFFIGYLNKEIYLNIGIVLNFSVTEHCSINCGILYKDIEALNKKLSKKKMTNKEIKEELTDIFSEEADLRETLESILLMQRNENDRHIFLIGAPGSGKTYGMQKFMTLCKKNNVCSFMSSLFGYNCGGYTGTSFPDYMKNCVNQCPTKEQALNMVMIFDEIDKSTTSTDTMRQEVLHMMLTYTTVGAFVNETKFGSISTKNMSFILLGSYSNIIPYADEISKVLFTENDIMILGGEKFYKSIDDAVISIHEICQDVKKFDHGDKFKKEVINYLSILFFALIYFDFVNYTEFLTSVSQSVDCLKSIMFDFCIDNNILSFVRLKFNRFLDMYINAKNKVDDKIQLIKKYVTSVDLIDRVKFFEIKDCNENINIDSVVSYYRNDKNVAQKCKINFNLLNLREKLIILSVKIKNWRTLREMNEFVLSVKKADILCIENNKKKYLNPFSDNCHNYVNEDEVKFVETNDLNEMIKVARWLSMKKWFKNGDFDSKFLAKDIIHRFHSEAKFFSSDFFNEVIEDIKKKNTDCCYHNTLESVSYLDNLQKLLDQNKSLVKE